MPTRDEFLVAELQSTSENDWSVSALERALSFGECLKACLR